jgi:hypothetical protein
MSVSTFGTTSKGAAQFGHLYERSWVVVRCIF